MTDANHRAIVTASRLLGAVCRIGCIAIPVLLGALWAFGSEGFLLSGEPAYYLVPHGVAFEAGRLGPGLRLLGFAISMIPGALASWALWYLATLFGCFARLELFTAQTVRCLRLFAVAVLLTGLVRPLASGLMSLATTFGNSPDDRYLALTAGDGELAAILLGGVLLVIARVMEQGRRIAEENEQIV